MIESVRHTVLQDIFVGPWLIDFSALHTNSIDIRHRNEVFCTNNILPVAVRASFSFLHLLFLVLQLTRRMVIVLLRLWSTCDIVVTQHNLSTPSLNIWTMSLIEIWSKLKSLPRTHLLVLLLFSVFFFLSFTYSVLHPLSFFHFSTSEHSSSWVRELGDLLPFLDLRWLHKYEFYLDTWHLTIPGIEDHALTVFIGMCS